jgi:hypothetical protein
VATSAGSTATAAPAATTVTSAEPATTAATEPATTAAPDTTPAPATTQPPKGESISIGKCWTNATATASGQLLISAKSSDSSATLSAYRSDGSLIGPVNNGFGGRYGGTVMPIQQHDPGTIIVKSDSGASASCHTTPFEVQP